MTITTQRSAHSAADRQARPATSEAWRLSRTAVPLMGPADRATAVMLMGPADRAASALLMGPADRTTAVPLMGHGDRATAVPLMGPADPGVTPVMSPWR
jgi:hypothetical protein